MGRLLDALLRMLDIRVTTVSREEAALELMGEEVKFIWRPVIVTKNGV